MFCRRHIHPTTYTTFCRHLFIYVAILINEKFQNRKLCYYVEIRFFLEITIPKSERYQTFTGNHNQSFLTQKNPHDKCQKCTISSICVIFGRIFHIYDFVIFSVAKDALRDLKFFFLTNNPRLVNFLLGTTIKAFSLKI